MILTGMRSQIHRNRFAMITATGVALLGASTVAYGQTAPAAKAATAPVSSPPLLGQCFARPINRVYVPRTGGRFSVTTGPDKFAYVQFPDSVTLDNIIFQHRGFDVDQTVHAMSVSPSNNLAHGDSSSMVIKTNDLQVVMDMKVDSTPGLPASVLYVIPLPVEDFERHKAEEKARQAEERRERDASIMEAWRRSAAKRLLDLKELRPSGPRVAMAGTTDTTVPVSTHYAEPDTIQAVLTRILVSEGFRYLEVVVDNRADKGVKLDGAWIAEGVDEALPVDVVFDKAVQPTDTKLGRIPAGKKARAMVVVPESITSGLDALTVMLVGPTPSTTLVAQQVVEMWPRMPAPIARKRRWAKQVALSVRLLGGGFWTGDAVDGTEAIAGTGMTGLGVRFTKGYSHSLEC